MAPTISAIKTSYNGIVYRSKTEARWAVFFDLAGINVEYEEEGYNLPSGGYLPDFWIPELECFFEVKGSWPDDFTKQEELHKATGKPVVVAIGSPGSKLGTLYGYRREPMSVYHTIGNFDGKAATEFVQLWGLEWTISQRLHDIDDADWGHISAIVGKAAAYQFPRWNPPVAEVGPPRRRETSKRPGDDGLFHSKFGAGIVCSYDRDQYGREIVYATFIGGNGTTSPSPLLASHVTIVDRRFTGWTSGAPERTLSARLINQKRYFRMLDGMWAQSGEPKFMCLECEEITKVDDGGVMINDDDTGWEHVIQIDRHVIKHYAGIAYDAIERESTLNRKVSFYCWSCTQCLNAGTD